MPGTVAEPPASSQAELRRAIDRWAGWVAELAEHPLDRFEYDELVSTRSRLEPMLEIVGEEALWDLVDEIDTRFIDLTVEAEDGTGHTSRPRGWWSTRLPASEHAREYLRGDR